MEFIKKRLFILLALVIVYGGYFVTHVPSNHKAENVLGANANLFLFTQPQDGKQPLLSAITQATKSIDVEMYLLSDKDIISALIASCERGVTVQVLLEQHPFGGGNNNEKTKSTLGTSCVKLEWTNPAFTLTHEKTITIDNSEVFILNQNLTTSSFSKNREYDIEDSNPADIVEIEKLFSADWNRQQFSPEDNNLLVSPLTSREKLESLISSATKSLSIEMEVIDDQEVMHLLETKAQIIPIQVIMPSAVQVPASKRVLEEFAKNNIAVKTLKNPYIHAKLIISDNTKAYVGSVNLTTQSMDSNREVGILIAQPDIVASVVNDFSADWDTASSE